MVVSHQDSQTVGETVATLFTLVGLSSLGVQMLIKNSGVNTMNYRFQEWNGTTWVDLGPSGSDFYNTLSPNQSKPLTIVSSATKVQMVGNASGGAFLEFTDQQYFDRDSGGALPVLNL